MEEYLENIIAEELEEVIDKFVSYLESCNVSVDSKTFNNCLRRLDDVVAMRKDKKYLGVSVNENGYITDIVSVDGIIEKQVTPSDLLRGYYKYEKGKFLLDVKMREKIWG